MKGKSSDWKDIPPILGMCFHVLTWLCYLVTFCWFRGMHEWDAARAQHTPKWWCGVSFQCRSHRLIPLKYHVCWLESCQMHRGNEGEEAGTRDRNAVWAFALSFHFFSGCKACSKFLLWSLPLLHPPNSSGLCEMQESQQQGWRRWRILSRVVQDTTELLGCEDVDVQLWVWMDGTRFQGAIDTGREELAMYNSTMTRSSREQGGVRSTVPALRTI